MIFLPNFLERYMSALRCSIQYLTEKNGIKPKYLKMLKKIYKAEAIIGDEVLPVNILDYTENLLFAIYVKRVNRNKCFHFSVNSTGNYLINVKAYTSLLLDISLNSQNLWIENVKGNIIIKADMLYKEENNKILKVLKGYYYNIRYDNKSVFVIPSIFTGKRELQFNNIWDYLANPFSEVNMWIE